MMGTEKAGREAIVERPHDKLTPISNCLGWNVNPENGGLTVYTKGGGQVDFAPYAWFCIGYAKDEAEAAS